MQLGGFLQFVPFEGGQRGVGAAAFQAVVVEQLAEFLWFFIPPVIPGEFDALISHLPDGFDGAGEILGNERADGIEFQADGNFLLRLLAADNK